MKSPMPASEDRETNNRNYWSKAAIASGILSVIGFLTLGLVFGLFVAAIGAVCGHAGKYDAISTGKRGRRLAMLGIGVGYTAMFLFPVLVALAGAAGPVLGKFKSNQGAYLVALSQKNAARLYSECEAFARNNKNRYPTGFYQLSGKYVPEADLASILKSPHPGGEKIAFEIVPHDRPVLDAIADSVIVIQEIAPYNVKVIAVVYANGKVDTLHNPSYEIP